MAQSANVAVLPVAYPQRAQASSPMVAEAEWNLQGTLSLNRFIPLFRVPAGVRIRNLVADFPQMDSGGSPTGTVSIGTQASPALFLAATAVSAAGGTKSSAIATTGLNYITTSEIIVGLTVAAAAATTNPAPATPVYVALEYKDQ